MTELAELLGAGGRGLEPTETRDDLGRARTLRPVRRRRVQRHGAETVAGAAAIGVAGPGVGRAARLPHRRPRRPRPRARRPAEAPTPTATASAVPPSPPRSDRDAAARPPPPARTPALGGWWPPASRSRTRPGPRDVRLQPEAAAPGLAHRGAVQACRQPSGATDDVLGRGARERPPGARARCGSRPTPAGSTCGTGDPERRSRARPRRTPLGRRPGVARRGRIWQTAASEIGVVAAAASHHLAATLPRVRIGGAPDRDVVTRGRYRHRPPDRGARRAGRCHRVLCRWLDVRHRRSSRPAHAPTGGAGASTSPPPRSRGRCRGDWL